MTRLTVFSSGLALILTSASYAQSGRKGDATVAMSERAVFLQDAGNPTHYVKLAAPDSIGADYSFVLPTTAGSNGEFLSTDGVGNLSWTSTLLNPMSGTGDIIYGGMSGTPSSLGGNSTTTTKILTEIGDGTNANAPTWNQIDDPDYFTTGAEVTQSAPGVVKSAGQLKGTNTNDDAGSGYAGEFLHASASSTSPGSSGTYVSLASINLSPGDWDVEATGVFTPGTINNLTYLVVAVSTNSSTPDSTSNGGIATNESGTAGTLSAKYIPTGSRRLSLSNTTTIYLIGRANYTTAGTAMWDMGSFIRARRVR